jgi:hypothetical protein
VLVAWDEARRSFVEKLRGLGLLLRVLVIAPPGGSTALDPGPLRNEPDRFSVLEVGQVELGVAGLK